MYDFRLGLPIVCGASMCSSRVLTIATLLVASWFAASSLAQTPRAPLEQAAELPTEQLGQSTAPQLRQPTQLQPVDQVPAPENANAGSVEVPERLPTPEPQEAPDLRAVALSVRNHFPLIRQAIAARVIASGEVLAARGAFDHKLDGYSNTQPLDFYENNWHNLGLKRDTYWGGQVFAGYRIGRGSFEPWYKERETNAGGEFKAGLCGAVGTKS